MWCLQHPAQPAVKLTFLWSSLPLLAVLPLQTMQLCSQSPKQLTQEFCLRLVALLLVVLATVGLAYRLAKKDD
jgi:cyanate permease